MVFLASGQYTLSMRTYAPYRNVVRSTQRHDMEPFRRLTKKDTPWNWSDERDSAFRKIQHMVREASLLSYYDPSSEFTMCDASQSGLGAALLQDGLYIEYAS